MSKNMKNKVAVLLSVALLSFGNIYVVSACACGPELPVSTPNTGGGGVVWVGLYNGAPFSWSRYVAPVIYISTNGTTTVVRTSTSTGQVAGVNKFIFNKDQYIWASKNKINPDITELQKVLVAEGLLGNTSQTGVYDVTTRAAVEAFQKKYGIKPAAQYPYGYFGPLTRNFLNSR